MVKHNWVVVANGSECKVFLINLKEKHIELLRKFESPEARVHAIELTSDKPGKAYESVGILGHGMAPKFNQHTKEKAKFAHMIATFLNDELNLHSFKSLILMASPEFLGEIRKYLHKNTISKIVKEKNKDLVHAQEAEILEHVLL